MRLDLENLPVNLARGSGLNVDDANGVNVRILRGSVWLTQEGSLDDFFLNAGDSHRLDGDGRVIISAEGRADATIAFDTLPTVQAPPGRVSPFRDRHSPRGTSQAAR